MGATYDANDIINGLYGSIYDENGQEQQGTQEFEAKVDLDKEAVVMAGKFLKGHKVMGGEGKGKVTLHHIDTRLQKKIADDPTAKFNYVGKLADPTAKGEEAVLLEGVSFDSIPILNFKVGELGEIEVDFTFEDYRYLDTID